MHATIFGQISPEFPFVTLGAQTETGYIFNEAVSGGHSCSSSTTTTLCCRLVTISAWSWWSEKKTIRWADFPRENPPMNVFVHLLMQHVATLPHLCRLRVQFVAFDTSNMLFSPTPPLLKLPEWDVSLCWLSVSLKPAWDDEAILDWAHISGNIPKRCRSLWLSRLPSITN